MRDLLPRSSVSVSSEQHGRLHQFVPPFTDFVSVSLAAPLMGIAASGAVDSNGSWPSSEVAKSAQTIIGMQSVDIGQVHTFNARLVG